MKTGKTSLAVKWPKNLLCAFERGYNALSGIDKVDIPSWATFKQVVRELKKPQVQEKFDSIVIDTTSIAWDKCAEYICQQNDVTDLADVAWGKGFKACSKEFEKTFREISLMGYGIVFLAHAEEKIPFGGDESQAYIAPMLDKRPYRIVNGMVDIISCIDIAVQPDGTENRFLQLRATPKIFAGSRFKYMPDRVPLDYNVFMNALADAIEKQGEETGYITDERQNEEVEVKRPFDEVMNEARDIWNKILDKDDSPQIEERLTEIIKNNFGEVVQLSTVQPSKQAMLEMTILDLKDLYEEL